VTSETVRILDREYHLGAVYRPRKGFGAVRKLVGFEDWNTGSNSGTVHWRRPWSDKIRECWCSTWADWCGEEGERPAPAVRLGDTDHREQGEEP
jgi:hypothetical protein